MARPLYGEVRRSAPPTKLRRRRGLVAAELAESNRRDDIQVVVRRATLSLDSDLTPDPDLLVGAAHGNSRGFKLSSCGSGRAKLQWRITELVLP